MNNLFAFVIFFLAFTNLVSAQEDRESLVKKFKYYQSIQIDTVPTILDWGKGYIITKVNDTIYGEIRKIGYPTTGSPMVGANGNFTSGSVIGTYSFINIKIRNAQIGEKKFRADKVQSFIIDKEEYLSIKPLNESIFVKVFVDGPISIFISEYYDQVISTGKLVLVKRENFIYSEKENEYYKASKKSIRQLLDTLALEYADLKQIIENSEFDINDYIAIILLYNDYKSNCN